MYSLKSSHLLVITVLFCTLGCAAKKITTVTIPVKTKLSNYRFIQITQFVYDASVDIDNQVAAAQLRDMFQERVRFDIYNLNIFEKVIDKDLSTDADKMVILRGKITYMKRVTKATRIMAGAMAGRSRVDVDIQLVEASTGDILGEAAIKGTSTGGSVFAGGTEEAFQNASQEIAQFIRNSYY